MLKVRLSEEVFVSIAAFRFCRYSVAVMVWLCFVLRQELIMAAVFILLAASAVLTIRHAPLIRIYDWTFGRIPALKGKDIVLQVDAMRFAHILGALLSAGCLVFLYTGTRYAWQIVLVFALLKSVSAMGFCPGDKIFRCIGSGGCCSFTRLKK
ncbi:MAG: DUF4395 domain-containing protein [bacterium]|nr:DUF4395 domain-containing protein [bacterium]